MCKCSQGGTTNAKCMHSALFEPSMRSAADPCGHIPGLKQLNDIIYQPVALRNSSLQTWWPTILYTFHVLTINLCRFFKFIIVVFHFQFCRALEVNLLGTTFCFRTLIKTQKWGAYPAIPVSRRGNNEYDAHEWYPISQELDFFQLSWAGSGAGNFARVGRKTEAWSR
jgi:hypothetical protein